MAGVTDNGNQPETVKPPLVRIWARLRDDARWPRSWWWPSETSDSGHSPNWQELHDEASKTIRRVMLTIVGYSFFCILTLATSDKTLVENNNKINLPFAQTEIDFSNFLIIGPVVLIGLMIYMHIFIAYWRMIPQGMVHRPLPFIFNMPGRFARLLSGFLFYWLTPLVLLIFVWKASSLADLPLLLLMTALVTTALVFLEIRYRPPTHRKGMRYATLWVALVALTAISGKFLWQQTIEQGPVLIAFASDVAEPVVVALLPAWIDEPEPRKTAPASTEPAPTAASPAPPEPEQQIAQVQQSARPLSRGLNLAKADLQKADLMSRDLIRADLRGANLSGISIRGGKEVKRFDFANLTDADLSGARFTNVSFFNANLRGVNLAGATLRSIFFVGADLRGADLSDTVIGTVFITSADIRGVTGLDCSKLKRFSGWEKAVRDPRLACGQPIPELTAKKK